MRNPHIFFLKLYSLLYFSLVIEIFIIMELFDTNNPHPYEEEMWSDFERHLKEIVLQRFKLLEPKLTGKHIYSLKITKIPTRINYHLFDYEKLNDISRKVVNGMTSYGTIPNRKFWNRYFQGGVRTISIKQDDWDEFPSFTLNFLLYSEYDNLDVRIGSQLSTRLKMIDPTLICKLEYIGIYKLSIIGEHLDSSTRFEIDSPTVVKLGERNFQLMVLNPVRRPSFLGTLFNPSKIL